MNSTSSLHFSMSIRWSDSALPSQKRFWEFWDAQPATLITTRTAQWAPQDPTNGMSKISTNKNILSSVPPEHATSNMRGPPNSSIQRTSRCSKTTKIWLESQTGCGSWLKKQKTAHLPTSLYATFGFPGGSSTTLPLPNTNSTTQISIYRQETTTQHSKSTKVCSYAILRIAGRSTTHTDARNCSQKITTPSSLMHAGRWVTTHFRKISEGGVRFFQFQHFFDFFKNSRKNIEQK